MAEEPPATVEDETPAAAPDDSPNAVGNAVAVLLSVLA
jgi:hypothetical protein